MVAKPLPNSVLIVRMFFDGSPAPGNQWHRCPDLDSGRISALSHHHSHLLRWGCGDQSCAECRSSRLCAQEHAEGGVANLDPLGSFGSTPGSTRGSVTTG